MNTDANTTELFRLLRNRPAMLMKGDTNSYLNYVVFFEGFFLSLKLFSEIYIERKVSSWYQNQVEFKAPNMYWFDQFDIVNENENDQRKIEFLITCLETFFKENFL